MAYPAPMQNKLSRAGREAGIQLYTDLYTGDEYMVHICRMLLKSGGLEQLEQIKQHCSSRIGLSDLIITANDPMLQPETYVGAGGREHTRFVPVTDYVGRSVAIGLPITQAERSYDLLNCLLELGYTPEVKMLNKDRWSFWQHRCRERRRGRE